ncbi:hypothetical protein D9M70_651970 [compost metagenome]
MEQLPICRRVDWSDKGFSLSLTVEFQLRQVFEELHADGTTLRVEELQRLAVPNIDHGPRNFAKIARSCQAVKFQRDLLMYVV